ncbi:MAG: UDP-N-acetylglucosamine 2-epimerase (non-hydrolyzing) [Clostridiales bacterium]|nr:UDP-N-acetylglucosamine 2-epimerase (non-hydrolyzing) [Clostridiales bacterium]
MSRTVEVLSVFGTRPEAIKMAPLVAELQRRPLFRSRVCVTAQHRELLDMVNRHFAISPDFDLDVMRAGQTLCGLASRVLAGMEQVFAQAAPALVLVHGDTATTAVCALAAFYAGIPVGHVEAGLRTFDRRSPFPEEGNRLVAGHLADIHFAPTARNAQYLKQENIKKNVYITGNTVIDALAYTVRPDYAFAQPALQDLATRFAHTVVVTAHRRENHGAPLEQICGALRTLAGRYPDTCFVYPVHPNPAVRQTAERLLSGLPNLLLLPPLDTADMHNLMARCRFVMTDSGGLQEEAPALGKPVLVLRRETERPEAIEAGTALLCGTRQEAVVAAAVRLLEDEAAYQAMAQAINPYGDGRASPRIADAIEHFFGLRELPPPPFLGCAEGGGD